MERRDAGADRHGAYFSKFENSAESQAILQALQPQSDQVVIELGVESGRIAATYRQMVHGVLGVDLSLKSLEIARGGRPIIVSSATRQLDRRDLRSILYLVVFALGDNYENDPWALQRVGLAGSDDASHALADG